MKRRIINTEFYRDTIVRRKMTNYLRLDSCKQLVGQRSVSSKINSRRYLLFLIAVIILAIGLFYIFF